MNWAACRKCVSWAFWGLLAAADLIALALLTVMVMNV